MAVKITNALKNMVLHYEIKLIWSYFGSILQKLQKKCKWRGFVTQLVLIKYLTLSNKQHISLKNSHLSQLI